MYRKRKGSCLCDGGSKKMNEHISKINILSLQITALLELMQCANDSVDISSIRVASEMCLTMHDELMGEVNKITEKLKEGK